LKRVTFCLVCGATPPVDATRCGDCGAPLREKKKPRRLPRLGRPAPLTLLVALTVAAVVVAAITFLLTL